MKRLFMSAVTVLLSTSFMLAGCGGGDANSSAESNNTGKDRVVIYTAAEDERIAYIQQELDKKFPDTEIVIQSLGTGQLLSKLQAEGVNTDCDIFYDLEVVNAEIILNENPDLFVDLSDYDLVIHCGACMLGETEVASRYRKAEEQGVPMTNYGIAIGKMKGILERVIRFT